MKKEYNEWYEVEGGKRDLVYSINNFKALEDIKVLTSTCKNPESGNFYLEKGESAKAAWKEGKVVCLASLHLTYNGKGKKISSYCFPVYGGLCFVKDKKEVKPALMLYAVEPFTEKVKARGWISLFTAPARDFYKEYNGEKSPKNLKKNTIEEARFFRKYISESIDEEARKEQADINIYTQRLGLCSIRKRLCKDILKFAVSSRFLVFSGLKTIEEEEEEKTYDAVKSFKESLLKLESDAEKEEKEEEEKAKKEAEKEEEEEAKKWDKMIKEIRKKEKELYKEEEKEPEKASAPEEEPEKASAPEKVYINTIFLDTIFYSIRASKGLPCNAEKEPEEEPEKASAPEKEPEKASAPEKEPEKASVRKKSRKKVIYIKEKKELATCNGRIILEKTTKKRRARAPEKEPEKSAPKKVYYTKKLFWGGLKS